MKCNFILRVEANDLKNLEINLVPLSKVTWAGTPCLKNTFFMKISARLFM